MAGDSQGQLPGRARRLARRPRVNYLDLLRAVRENDDPNPDTPMGGQRKRQAGSGGSGESVLPSPTTAAAAAQAGEPAAAGNAADDHVLGGSAAAAVPALAADEEQAVRPARRQRLAKLAAQDVLQQASEEQAADGPTKEAFGAGTSSAAAAGTAAVAPAASRRKRQRVLVDVHGGTAGSGAAGRQPAEVENEYERQRLERIRRNEQMLRQLGVQEAAGGFAAAVAAEQRSAAQAACSGRPRPRQRERRPAAPALPIPARKSARQRGDRALAPEEAVAAVAAELVGAAAAQDLPHAGETELEHAALLDLEQYFQLTGQDISGAVHSDGRFRGWVNPAVCERYGIAPDPDAAWEAGGGGRFSFKIDKQAIPSTLKGRGWSDARAFSHTQLQKNPNAYFYRHVAPHEQQAQGEWTEEEHRLFVETARAHGVGDKWGLFASYLPQRVGYQCSAFYRDVIIPQGLVLDKRFKMTRNGKAVFVG